MAKLIKIMRTANFPKVGDAILEWGKNGEPDRYLKVEKIKTQSMRAAGMGGELCWVWGREITKEEARAQWVTEQAAMPKIPEWL